MAKQWKKIVLAMKQNLELIEQVENGESAATLARAYAIGVQTVVDIKKNKRKLEEFVGDW